MHPWRTSWWSVRRGGGLGIGAIAAALLGASVAAAGQAPAGASPAGAAPPAGAAGAARPAAPPSAPLSLTAADVPLDEGGAVTLTWTVPTDAPGSIERFVIRRTMNSGELAALRLQRRQAVYEAQYAKLTGEGVAPEQARTQAAMEAQQRVPTPAAGAAPAVEWTAAAEVPAGAPGSVMTFTVTGLDPGLEHRFQVIAQGRAGDSAPAVAGPIGATPGSFLRSKAFLLAWILAICGAVVAFILVARRGAPMRIRRIAALEAVDEAVGRATEMGRPVLFIPGIQDMDNVQTIAGITVLSRVAKTVAEYDATIEVPTARSLAMQASREAVQTSYMQAGRSESFNPDLVTYITDEQFGFVAYVAGRMVREKPAACFYMGCFFAESLVLAETGNSIGAIQIAGTAESSQLPFFVAACDYTLIGEEFFAASAYLSGEPDQIGSIKGQDVGKALAILVIVAVALLGAANAIAPGRGLDRVIDLIRTALTT